MISAASACYTCECKTKAVWLDYNQTDHQKVSSGKMQNSAERLLLVSGTTFICILLIYI